MADIAAAKSLAADAVIYPSAELGSLAERRLIRPLSAEWLDLEEFHRSDFFDPAGVAQTRWGDRTYAAPFGSPVFVLVFRRDLFERYHLELPRTWADYQRIVEAIGGHAKDLPQLKTVAVEPLAAGWAGKALLARAAAYAKHRDYYSTLFDKDTMQPQIASPAFVRALEELVAATKSSATESLAATPEDARQAVLTGRCALAITWPTAAKQFVASGNAKESSAPFVEQMAFAELPGATEVYDPKAKTWGPVSLSGESRASNTSSASSGRAESRVPLVGISGRLGSLSNESESGQFAFQLLAWLSGNEWGAQVCSASPATTIFRRSELGQPGRWIEPEISAVAAKQYASAVADSLSRSQWLECPRIPGHTEYIAALDDAVRAAVDGKQKPADALQKVSDRWRDITARLGIDSQRSAYIRSLGLEP